jgi:hypothetical protein
MYLWLIKLTTVLWSLTQYLLKNNKHLMLPILSILLAVIFLVLSAIHVYWLFGGKWGLAQAVPAKSATEPFTPPPAIATLLVALVLLGFSSVYVIKSGMVSTSLLNTINPYVYWIIPSMFVIRAIGEFKYVGFFKRVKDTPFAQADTRWFSPLCLGMGLLGVVIQLVH